MMIQKNIGITEEQDKYVTENFMNLSKFVRNKLDEVLKCKNKMKKKTN